MKLIKGIFLGIVRTMTPIRPRLVNIPASRNIKIIRIILDESELNLINKEVKLKTYPGTFNKINKRNYRIGDMRHFSFISGNTLMNDF